MAQRVTGKRVTGESEKSFADAAQNAGDKTGDGEGTGRAVEIEVEVEHHSPGHIKTYRVTLEQ